MIRASCRPGEGASQTPPGTKRRRRNHGKRNYRATNAEGHGYIQRGHYALDVIPLGWFRAELMGHPYGVAGSFLAYGQPYTPTQACAFTLLHDVLVRRSFDQNWMKFKSRLWKLSDDFGRKEAEWLPYWKNSAYVAAQPAGVDDGPGVYVSLYRHEKNGVLAVVSNLCREQADVNVQFDLRRLGLAGKKLSARDGLTGETVPMEVGKITFKGMPSMGWRLVWIR